jgi:hypothetical protein
LTTTATLSAGNDSIENDETTKPFLLQVPWGKHHCGQDTKDNTGFPCLKTEMEDLFCVSDYYFQDLILIVIWLVASVLIYLPVLNLFP